MLVGSALSGVELVAPPQPDDTVLALIVHETQCASGHTAEGRIVPDASTPRRRSG